MRQKHRIQGMSLLELIIALAVIAIAFFALALTQISSLTTTAHAREISDARTYANRVLETVRRDVTINVLNAGGIAARKAEWEKYAQGTCPVVTDPPASAGTPAICKGTPTPEGNYTAHWVVGPESGPTPVAVNDEGLLQVRMRVDWTKGGVQKTLSFVDYIGCGSIDLDICPEPRIPAGHE